MIGDFDIELDRVDPEPLAVAIEGFRVVVASEGESAGGSAAATPTVEVGLDLDGQRFRLRCSWRSAPESPVPLDTWTPVPETGFRLRVTSRPFATEQPLIPANPDGLALACGPADDPRKLLPPRDRRVVFGSDSSRADVVLDAASGEQLHPVRIACTGFDCRIARGGEHVPTAFDRSESGATYAAGEKIRMGKLNVAADAAIAEFLEPLQPRLSAQRLREIERQRQAERDHRADSAAAQAGADGAPSVKSTRADPLSASPEPPAPPARTEPALAQVVAASAQPDQVRGFGVAAGGEGAAAAKVEDAKGSMAAKGGGSARSSKPASRSTADGPDAPGRESDGASGSAARRGAPSRKRRAAKGRSPFEIAAAVGIVLLVILIAVALLAL